MRLKFINRLIGYLRNNIIFVLLFLGMLFVEIYIFNNQFIVSKLFGLPEIVFDLSENENNFDGFIYINGKLIAENHDPNITIDNIDKWIKFINVSCTNTDPEAISQIFYRKDDEGWAEENSVKFYLNNSETTVSLPTIRKTTGLRLDLTNKQGDILVCDGITLNPKGQINFRPVRTILFLVIIIGLLFGGKVIPSQFSYATWNLLISNGRWFFIILLIYINLRYPLTITYDSAHYLWLADLIRTRDFASWDPFRTALFPLKIHLSLSHFGYSQIALLLPMIVSQFFLFIVGSQIAQNVLKATQKNIKIIINLSVFLFISLDPTIVGYFHTLLTEYAVAFIAMISCYLALNIYHTPIFSKKFYLLTSLVLILTVISWHIKQPYIGAALYPFLISITLIVIRDYSLKILSFGLISVVTVIIVVFASNTAWNSFLERQNNPMVEERIISEFLDTTVEVRTTTLEENFTDFIHYHLHLYLRSINLIPHPTLDSGQSISLLQGFQNDLIAHRMFKNRGISNMYYQDPFLDQYSRYFISTYNPPKLINPVFLARLKASHFLFTISYLLIPFVFIIALVYWFKNMSSFSLTILILSGTSLFNAIAHLLVWPIDRYLFLGYPLNLLIILIMVFFSISRMLKENNVSTLSSD